MARVSNHLEQLVREAEVLASIKNDVPNAWKILEMEIGRARAAVVRAADADLALSASPPDPPAALHDHAPRHSVRKRVKLRVPADQYPEYNFVGRLLGPRGATLKRLERDTGCRIMIRGKGSIRKDKEPDVRGKPGWEHVFNEPLHVVIEVVDSPDDLSATRILAHAKKLVEILLIPVPEERDSLKRAQLRDLAILNGTHRSVSDLLGATPHNVPLPAVHRSNPLAASPPPLRRAQSQHSKPSQKMYANDYANMFEPLLPFARHNSFSSPPPPPSQRPLHNLAPYAHSNAFASTSHDSLLSELEKLRLPALDFDHLTEPNLAHNNYNNNNNNNNINNHRHHHNSNILNNNNDSNNIPNNKNKHNNNNNNNNNTNIANIANNNIPNNINSNNNANNINNNLNSNSNLPVPAPSPTIVDPEIYPYPPTPGVLSADQQLSAFASPMWTPSRAAASTMSSSSLPPRSPPAAADNNNQPTSSFLLGRTLGDFSRHTQAHGAHDLAPMDGVSFDQCFAPHHAPQFGDVDGRDCVSAHKHPFSAMRNSNGDAIVLANLFHTAPTTGSSCKPFDQRRALSSSSSSSSCHVERGESLNVSKQQQAVHQCSAPVRAQQQSAGAQTGGAHGQAGRSSPQPSGGGGGGGSQGERKAPQDC